MREQPLTGHVDLPLQVGQLGGLGRCIGVKVDSQPVGIYPVEYEDGGTERFSVG
jgi:hypothetical protein